jgi:hypothetical protein
MSDDNERRDNNRLMAEAFIAKSVHAPRLVSLIPHSEALDGRPLSHADNTRGNFGPAFDPLPLKVYQEPGCSETGLGKVFSGTEKGYGALARCPS